MNKKYLAFSLITIFLFFLSLELITRLFAVAGSYDFIERAAIQQGLKVHKQSGEFRIFLFGESTMHGTHLFPRSTIKKWMELYFENLLGEETAKKITVINFGRLGCDSRFILQSFKDTLVYKPDLVVIYSAHNNLVQLEIRDELLRKKSISEKFSEFMQEIIKKSTFISTMKRLSVLAKIKRSEKREKESKDEWYIEEEKKMNSETDLMKPDSLEFHQILEAWEKDIRKIAQVAQKKNIPIIFSQGLAKYKDFKPFSSQHSESLDEGHLKKWQQAFDQGEKSFKEGNYFEAMTMYQEAMKYDQEYALVYFRLGQCLEQLGDYQRAYENFIRANQKDYFPLRAPVEVNQFYQKFDRESLKGVYIIPTQQIFDQQSKNGMVDDELVVDHIHPTMKGQALMAKEILNVIYKNNLMKNSQKWNWNSLLSFEELSRKINIDAEFELHLQLWLANYVGSYLDTAESYLKKALQINPRSIHAKSQLAWIYWKAKRFDEANKLYQELIRQDSLQAENFFQRHPEIRDLVK